MSSTNISEPVHRKEVEVTSRLVCHTARNEPLAPPQISSKPLAPVSLSRRQVLVRKHLSDVPALLAQIAFGALKAVMDLVQSSAVGHAAKPFSSDACDFARRGLAENILAQPTAVELLSTAVCDHIKSRVPRKPLVVSAHGPPGVGKSLTHRTLALTLWNVAMEDMAHCPGSACPGYFTIFGVDYTER